MYLKDRLVIALCEIIWIIAVALMVITNIINFYIGLVLIIAILLIGRVVVIIQEERYKRDIHDNLEKIAKNQNNNN